MNLSAAAIRLMADKGLTALDIAEIAEAMDVRRDPTAAERQQRRRDRMKAEAGFAEAGNDETITRDASHRDVTRDAQPVPSLDKSPQTPKINPNPAQHAPTRKGTRLSPDFEMPEDWKLWAKTERRWSDGDLATEAAAFVDYWHGKPGKDGLKLDWPGTWRNWVRNSRRPDRSPANDHSGYGVGHSGIPL